MPQDLPTADELVDVVAAHLAEQVRTGPPSVRRWESWAVAAILRRARGLPIGRVAALHALADHLSNRAVTVPGGAVSTPDRTAIEPDESAPTQAGTLPARYTTVAAPDDAVAERTATAADLLRIAAREFDMGAGIRRADQYRLRRLLDSDRSYSEPKTSRAQRLLDSDRSYADLEAALVRRLRDPAPIPDWERTLAYLRASAAERLRITNPGYARGNA
ncbi:DUF6285 domain-containing protein [Nocardia sp. NPDC127579]|uniref:DUF6285 domain-containing protein n=1 Tax=Nocardia sp. NPDC127579 TaxID=3345402 RepID=UPI0036346D7C